MAEWGPSKPCDEGDLQYRFEMQSNVFLPRSSADLVHLPSIKVAEAAVAAASTNAAEITVAAPRAMMTADRGGLRATLCCL